MKKTICYAEKRFFEWHEDDRSVTIREKGGSYGGGSETLVVYYIQDEPTPKIGGALHSPSKQNGEDVL